MTLYDWMRAGPAPRSTPTRRQVRGRNLIAFALLAAVGIVQTGCQSGGCGNCGFLRRTTSRMFNRTTSLVRGTPATGGCCGDSVVGETMVSDAPVTYGAAPSSVVVPGSSVPAGGAPMIEETPSSLDPLPSGTRPKAVPEKQGSNSLIPKLGYETSKPTGRAGRPRASNNLAQTSTSGNFSAPTSRSARESTVETPSTTDNPLDRLPPLDLPTEVTERSQSPPIAPAAERVEASKPATIDKVETKPAVKPQDTVKTEPAKSAGSSSVLPIDTSSAAVETPGIQRMVVVDIKLAGGSVPTTQGLDWLAEKGYKTLLDLRESTDIQPSFIAEVASRGMRYIALPISARTIDKNHVARFESEISPENARPLYFFDSDGTRPGTMWYIRRVTKDNYDPKIARQDAEELGLKDKAFWLAATQFVEKATAARISQLPHDSDVDTETTPASTSVSEPEPTAPKASKSPSASAGPITVPGAKTELASTRTEISKIEATAPPPTLASASVTPAAPRETPETFKNRGSWHPLAAVVTTGLTVPVAYWSRSILPLIFTAPMASLPGVAQPPKSLPSASGD